MCSYFSSFLVILLLILEYVSCRIVTNSCPRVYLKNGRIRTKQRGRFLKFSCNAGFLLAGERYSICQSDGTWDLPAPKCVKPTCYTKTQPPAHGLIFPSHGGGVLNFYCKSGYQLRGTPVMFCDGLKWDNHPPTCFPADVKPKLFCDFEDEDICHWTQDWNHDFDWRRENYQTPSGAIGTGPSFDHTKGESGKNGYYMYIESSSRRVNDTARLISPVFDRMSSNTCLEFWYHMYGATTGTLRAYIQKVSQPLPLDPKKAIFSKSGNQGNKWYRSFHNLGTIDEDFQIIMEGVRGNGYVSDIAIDDVKLIENCNYEDYILTTTEGSSTATEILKTVESCSNRCGSKADKNEDNAVITCDCDDSCFDHNRCCPDYWDVCFISTATYTYETSTTDLRDNVIESNETIYQNNSYKQPHQEPETTTEQKPITALTNRTTKTTISLKPTSTQKTTLKTIPSIKKSNTTPRTTPSTKNLSTTPKIVIKPSEIPIIQPQQHNIPLIKPNIPVKPIAPTKNPVVTSKKPVLPSKKPVAPPKNPVVPSKKPFVLPNKPTKPVEPKNTQLPLIILTQPTTEKIIEKILPNNEKNVKSVESIENNDIVDVIPGDKSDDKSADRSQNDEDEDFSLYDEKEETAKEFDTPYFQNDLKHSKKLSIQGQKENSNIKTIFVIIAASCGVTVLSLFAVILLVKYRIIKIYAGKMQTGNGTTSQSDVRFLTADEALDFSMDSASITSSTL